jgi:uncharacterized protein YbjT (DUF2867 family)
MRILIFGASGFIGTHLAQFMTGAGHEVIALCRTGKVSGFSGETISWTLGQPIPLSTLVNVACAIHLVHDFAGEEGSRRTIDSTLACIDCLRMSGLKRQLYFSSYSAGPHAQSLYGRTKYAIEQRVKGIESALIVRPGLVVGNGGIYGRIRKWARLLPVIPLPNGGKGKVPIITVERLCVETLALVVEPDPVREANLFQPESPTLRQVVFDAALVGGRRPLILPVSAGFVMVGLRLASALRIPLPVSEDNLGGFLSNQSAKHRSTLLG